MRNSNGRRQASQERISQIFEERQQGEDIALYLKLKTIKIALDVYLLLKFEPLLKIRFSDLCDVLGAWTM